MTGACLQFLSFVREGFVTGGTVVDSLTGPLPDRLPIKLSVMLDRQPTVGGDVPPPPHVHVRLYGPGDVTGIDVQQIIRTDPSPDTSTFDPLNLATIEFDRPDFPWLFTPASPDSQGRLRPWLFLVVVPADKAGLDDRTQPLPTLTCPLDELPDLDESWAWAHAQVALDATDDKIGPRLEGNPERTLSRIISPRRLLPRQRYLACLIPAFEPGRLVGLGREPGNGPLDLAWKWKPSDTTPIQLPVYYYWRFATAEEQDFASLATQMKARPLVADIGPPMDISQPGAGMPTLDPNTPGATLALEGALRAPKALPAAWPDEAKAVFQSGLERLLKEYATRLTPPLYGGVHAGFDQLPPAGQQPYWLRELNLDPRHRVAASFGVRVIQEQQEELMAIALMVDDGRLFEHQGRYNWNQDRGWYWSWCWLDLGNPGRKVLRLGPRMKPLSAVIGQSIFITTDDLTLYERYYDPNARINPVSGEPLAGWVWVPHGAPVGTNVLHLGSHSALDDASLFVGTADGNLFERHREGNQWLWIPHGAPPGGVAQLPWQGQMA